jgi:hypothetical protein
MIAENLAINGANRLKDGYLIFSSGSNQGAYLERK